MKRDMELVRSILLQLEKQEDFRDELKVPDEDSVKIAYHLKIMEQADLVEQKVQYADDLPMWMYASMTWDGQEFLSSIKNDNVWSKTKEGLKTKGMELSSVPMDVLYEYAKFQIKKVFGLD